MIAQAGTGLFANDEIAHVGPLYGWVSDPFSTNFTKVHHIIFKGIAALVALHIVAIAFYGCVLKTNLLTPMVTGRKPAQWVPESQAIGNSRTWLAIFIILILVSILAAIVTSAPRASLSIF
jgi:cytochrome b